MPPKSVEALLKETRIDEIINPRLVQASSDISLKKAIQMMQEYKAGYLVIADKRKVEGIFTETDVVNKVLGQDVNWNLPVREFMTLTPVVLNLKDSVITAIKLMGDRRFYHIPLVNDKNELVNVISVRTLIRFLAEYYPTEVYNLPPNPSQIMETAEGG